MAVNLPSGLYNAFTEVLDSTPTANRAYQDRVRTQAKMDALDEYDKQRINHINSVGVRDKDRQGFDTRLQKIQLYYNQNKDKIRKGGTPEAYEYEKLHRDVSNYINQSKERTAKQDAAMKLYQDKLKQDERVPDDFIHELNMNDMGIDDIVAFDKVSGQPIRSSSFDLTKWLGAPKPFNRESYVKGMTDVKRTPGTPRYEAVVGDPLRQNEIIEDKFDKDAKSVIASRAADKYQNSYSFSETVKEEMKDPNNRKDLEDVFVKEFGTRPQSMEDYATAYTFKLIPSTVVRSKPVANQGAIMTRRENMQREIQNRIDCRQAYGIAARRAFQVADQQAQDGYVDTMFDTYKTKGTLDPQIVADYEKPDGKGHKVPIDKQIFHPDGTVDFIVYKIDKKGNPTTEVDETYSTKGIPAPQIKARIRKELETPMTNTGGTPVRTPKEINKTKMAPKKDPLKLF